MPSAQRPSGHTDKREVNAVGHILQPAFVKSLGTRALDRALMQPWVHRLLLPLGRELQPQRWIFVIGCYNSGTTLLASILRQHPEIAGLRTEGVYLANDLPYPEAFGWPRMWCQCVDAVHIPVEGEAERAARIRRQWSLWYPRGARNLVEKSVANAARMPFLDAHFRPAYFIYIMRNGYAVAAGIRGKANLRRWRSPYADSGYPIELCARQWRVTDETVEQDAAKVERFLAIRYEDLVTAPGDTLERITGFLDLAPMPQTALQQSWNIHGSEATLQDMNAASLARLGPADLDAIEAEAGARLRRHGYTRPAVHSDTRSSSGRHDSAMIGH